MQEKSEILSTQIERDFPNLILKIKTDLITAIFDNNYTLDPYEFENFIYDQIEAFMAFLKTNENQWAALKGEKAAQKGLSEDIVKSVFITIKTFFQNHFATDPFTKEKQDLLFFAYYIVDKYKDSFISSYHKYCLEKGISEVESLHTSALEAYSAQQAYLLEKERELQSMNLEQITTIKCIIEEQFKQKSAFIQWLTHDMASGLTVISNLIEQYEQAFWEKKAKILPLLREEIGRFSKMVMDILDSERIEKGEPIYTHDEIVNISKVLEDKIEVYRATQDRQQIRISADLDNDVYIRITPSALDRIMSNVIDNAIKYNKVNGLIDISLKCEQNMAVFTVRDTGIGIPQEEIPMLCKAYYQVVTRHKGIKGLGAGLFIVKSILDDIGGTISIVSREGEGTTISITIPKLTITEQQKKYVVEDIKPEKPAYFRKNINTLQKEHDPGLPTVLAVEDKEELIVMMSNIFAGKFNFYFARNGKEALSTLKIIPRVDVIVSDIYMDVMNGYDLLNEVNKMMAIADVPFIFLTVLNTNTERVKALRLGAVSFIEKPFSGEFLIEEINALLRYRGRIIFLEHERMERLIKQVLKSTEEDKQLHFYHKCEEYNLTLREREIMQLVLQGYSDEAIAEELHLSPETIKKNMTNIRSKCKVKSRTQLIHLWQKNTPLLGKAIPF